MLITNNLEITMRRHLSYTSSFIMGGHAWRRSTSSWKSSHFCAASSSSWKRAYLFSSFSTSPIWTWEEGWRERERGSKISLTQIHWAQSTYQTNEACSSQSSHPFLSNSTTCALLQMNVMINGNVVHWEDLPLIFYLGCIHLTLSNTNATEKGERLLLILNEECFRLGWHNLTTKWLQQSVRSWHSCQTKTWMNHAQTRRVWKPANLKNSIKKNWNKASCVMARFTVGLEEPHLWLNLFYPIIGGKMKGRM